jgi:hypothetical protein
VSARGATIVIAAVLSISARHVASAARRSSSSLSAVESADLVEARSLVARLESYDVDPASAIARLRALGPAGVQGVLERIDETVAFGDPTVLCPVIDVLAESSSTAAVRELTRIAFDESLPGASWCAFLAVTQSRSREARRTLRRWLDEPAPPPRRWLDEELAAHLLAPPGEEGWFGGEDGPLQPELLARDEDSDGLPDEIERRLGLEPGATDTDHDGTPDGVDLTPDSAPRRARSAEEAALLAVVRTVLQYGWPRPDPSVFAVTGPSLHWVGPPDMAVVHARNHLLQRGVCQVDVRSTPSGERDPPDEWSRPEDGERVFHVDVTCDPMAGVGYEVFVRRTAGRAVVTRMETKWVS